MRKSEAGFSLAEFLVVISILGALFLVALNIIGFIAKVRTEGVGAEVNMVQTPVGARLANGGAVAADQTTNFRVISSTLGLEPYPQNTPKYYYRRITDGTVTQHEWRIIQYRTK